MRSLLLKELGAGARVGRTYVFRTAYALLLVLVVWTSLRGYARSPWAMTASESAEAGRALYTNFITVQFWGITLFALLAGADLVVREIRADTLGLLVLTALSGRDIVAAKWLAAIVHAGYLMLCGLPVLAASVYLGGAGVDELLATVFGTAASAILAAALSAWMASGGRNPYGAGALAAGAYLVYSILCLALQQGLPDLGPAGFIHPLGVMIAAAPGGSPPGVPVLGWITIVPFCTALSWVILIRAGALLLRPATVAPRNVQTSQEIVDRRTYLENAAQNLGTRIRDVDVWDRWPLLWKDVRTRAAAHLSVELRLAVGLTLVIIFAIGLVSEPQAQVLFFHFQFPVSLFLALSAGSAQFFRDRESGRADTLRVLPVSRGQVLASKLFSGPASPEGGLVLLLTVLSLHPFRNLRENNLLVQAAVASLLFLAFAYVFGSLASLLFHRTRIAILVSGLVVLLLLLGLPESLRVLNPYSYFTEPAPVLPLGIYSAAYLGVIALLIVLMLRILRVRRDG